MIVCKLIDYIKRVRIGFIRRVKDARFKVYNDHLMECEPCNSGYNNMCVKGRRKLMKCIDANKFKGEIKTL